MKRGFQILRRIVAGTLVVLMTAGTMAAGVFGTMAVIGSEGWEAVVIALASLMLGSVSLYMAYQVGMAMFEDPSMATPLIINNSVTKTDGLRQHGVRIPGTDGLEEGERARYTIQVYDPATGADGKILAVGQHQAAYVGYLTADQVRELLDAIGEVVNTRGVS